MPEQVEIAIEMNVVNGSRATLEGGEAEEGSSQGDAADQCPICLDGFERRTNTSCGHTFCSSCILKVLDHQQKQNKSLECPYCKQLVTYLRTEEPGSYTFSCMPELTQEAISILNERLMYLKVTFLVESVECAFAREDSESLRKQAHDALEDIVSRKRHLVLDVAEKAQEAMAGLSRERLYSTSLRCQLTTMRRKCDDLAIKLQAANKQQLEYSQALEDIVSQLRGCPRLNSGSIFEVAVAPMPNEAGGSSNLPPWYFYTQQHRLSLDHRGDSCSWYTHVNSARNIPPRISTLVTPALVGHPDIPVHTASSGTALASATNLQTKGRD